MTIRCGVSFQTAQELLSAYLARGPLVFVPFPDEVAPGSALELDVVVGEARVALRGEVVGPDFDDAGNVGLTVKLDEPSWATVQTVGRELSAGRSVTGLFASTRLTANPVPLPAGPESVPVPGDAKEEQLTPGTLVDGRFRIDAHLATGGMGEVYRAEHVHLRRPVALKLLRRALCGDADMWGRFEREAQLVSRLENPHVVRVFDFGRTADGQLFLAMEFVEGQTLEERLAQGPLPPAAAVEVLAQVLDGLHEAHGLGVVHRDLKPANIMLGHRRDGGERAKILDFGIARLTDALAPAENSRLTQLGVVVGTPAYLAPEQALADELDHRTDIYAMGCVAYELLTGAPPFVSEELRKIISMHLTAAPVDPAQVRPELAKFPRLCAAVLKALAKEREHRFQSVLEFREVLRASLALPLGELVPQASAAWPPADAPRPAPPPAPTPAVDDWQPLAPPPPVAPAAPPPETVAAADDFFASVGSGSLLPTAGAAAAPSTSGEGVVLRVEVMGVPPTSPQGQACAARAQALLTAAGCFSAARDEEGATFGLIGKGGSPAGRATRLLFSVRDAVAAEGARLGVPATMRAIAGPARFPLAGDALEKVRRQLATARAHALWLDQRLAGFASRLCEFSAAPTPGLVACGALRRRTRAAPELLGRKALADALERRLSSLAQGVGAPLLVKGPAASGHSSLAHLLVTVARKRGALALSATGLAEPFGALVELVCSAVGVHPSARHSKLLPALDALKLVDAAKQAALWLAGVRPLPQALTPGQAAHALRVVVRAVAGERPMVLVLDGLHAMDEGSVAAFAVMAARPASRELLVGFAAPSAHDAKLSELQTAALPPLSQVEVQRLCSVALGALAGPALTTFVLEHADGLPGAALHLLSWLEDAGLLLEAQGGVVELAEPEVQVPAKGPASAAVEAMPLELRQALQAAAVLGSRFDQGLLQAAFPAAATPVLAALHALGWLTGDGPRRMRFSSPALEAVVPPLGAAAAMALHQRVAAALIAQGTADPTSVDPLELAGHLTAAGDGARAAPLWKHALDQALGRRDPRAASRAWSGVAGAMALLPRSELQARGEVDALARAAALALAVEDTPRARALLDAAAKVAATLPSPSPEHLLVEARALRLEGRRVKAAEVLAAAEQAAGPGRVLALVLAERGGAREVEGDLAGAAAALEQALKLAPEAAELARWHGEVDLPARLEASLATLSFARRDVGRAVQLLEASLGRWRMAGWPFAEGRVLSTLGTVLAYQHRFADAAQSYAAAAAAGARSGDFKFQARALLQQAKALRRVQGDSPVMKGVATEAKKLALVVAWEEGRVDASALLGE